MADEQRERKGDVIRAIGQRWLVPDYGTDALGRAYAKSTIDVTDAVEKLLADERRHVGPVAVGRTIEEALAAFVVSRGCRAATDLEDYPLGDSGRYTWARRFSMDGASMKAAGVAVPGGYVITWWK